MTVFRSGSADLLPRHMGVLVMALALAGCGGSSGGDTPSDEGDPDPEMMNPEMTNPDEMNPDGMTPDGMTPDGMTPDETDTGGESGDGGDGNGTVGLASCPSLQGSGDFSAIAGLYDLTEEVDGEVDVFYTEITATGEVNGFDFQGDELDGGENCYLIDRGSSILTAMGGSTFGNVFYDDPDFDCTTTTDTGLIITRENNVLMVDAPDTFDDDEDGDTSERILDAFPVLSGIAVQDLNACE